MRNLTGISLALLALSACQKERPEQVVHVTSASASALGTRVLVVPSAVASTRRAPKPPPTSCPPSTAFIPSAGVCIHRWEVQLFQSDGKLHDPYSVPPHPDQMSEMVVQSKPGVMPQGYLGREQAEIACRNTVHGEHRFRLCSTAEWEAACRGPHAEFPTYQEAMVQRCNTGKFPEQEHLVYRFYPEPRWTYRELTDPRINREPGGLARTGQYARCTNGFGVFDMVGNLQEWTSDLHDRGELKHATIKGDHYMGQGKNHVGCAASNTAHFHLEPDDETYAIHKDWKDYSTGVRCCTEPR